MKKLFAVILIILITLTACSQATGDAPTVRKKPAAAESAKPISSPVFGKNVSFNSYIPADGLAMPIPSDKILDMVQIEKRIYILGDGGVHSLDIETGESLKLFDTSASFICAVGSELLMFDAKASSLGRYDTASELLSEISIPELSGPELSGFTVTDFSACEDCFVLLCGEEIVAVSCADGSIISRTKAKQFTKKLCTYSGSKILVYVGDAADTKSLYEFDPEKGSLKKLRDLPMLSNIFDMTYNSKSGTVVILGEGGNGITALYEYALDSEDNGILKKFDIKMNLYAGRFVSVFENIISVVSSDDDVYRWYDYENPPESIILAYAHEAVAQNSDLETIILNYEMTHDVIVRTVCYNEDSSRLSLKLMAGDCDIDIFSTVSLDGYLFIKSHMYTDLSDFPSLGGKIKSNALSDLAVGHNGEYVGLPYGVELMINEHENVSALTAIEQYCIKNVDALNGSFSDESGDELYKIMRFAVDNPEPQKAYFDFPYSVLRADCLIINPSSERKALAADFLEYAFDVYSGAQSVVSMSDDMLDYFNGSFGVEDEIFWEHYNNPIRYPYPDMPGAENVYPEMNFRPWSIVKPIFDAYNSARSGESPDNSELKKLAREAAAEVAMRIGE